jgi:4-amino-4-deoxy-L-arabinose transferase-like glycosyltransferase
MATLRGARLRVRASSDWPALTVVGVVVVVAVSWAVRERATPAWDQAVYLRNSWHLGRMLVEHGPIELARSFFSTTPSRAPLLALAMGPFVAVFGASASSALMLDVVLWPVLLLGIGAIASDLFGRRTRLLAIVLAATMPLLVGMSRALFQEFLVTTLAVVVVWLAARSRGFADPATTVGLGVVVGLGVLTKLIFPVYVVGPLLVLVFDAFRNRVDIDVRHLVRNLVVAAGIALAMAACWYGPNWGATLRYLQANTSDSSATVGTGRSFSTFVRELLDNSVSWFFALAGLVGLGLVIPRIARRIRYRELGWADVRGPLVLASWLVVPLVFVATGKLQTQRYLTATMPAVAMGIAAVLTRISLIWARRALVSVVVVAGVLQTALLAAPIRLPGISTEALTFPTPFGRGWIPLAGQAQGYERLPNTKDDATPIVRYLEAMSCGAGGPVVVGLLQTNSVTNHDTMRLVAELRGDPFVFRRQLADPNRLDDLADDLMTYDFVLYVPPTHGRRTTGARASALNRRYYAGAYMTPELLGLFTGPVRSFPIGGGEHVEVLARTAGCALARAPLRSATGADLRVPSRSPRMPPGRQEWESGWEAG